MSCVWCWQVSHHPPVVAMYTESKLWSSWQEFTMSSKFRGKYVQIIPLGEWSLSALGDDNNNSVTLLLFCFHLLIITNSCWVGIAACAVKNLSFCFFAVVVTALNINSVCQSISQNFMLHRKSQVNCFVNVHLCAALCLITFVVVIPDFHWVTVKQSAVLLDLLWCFSRHCSSCVLKGRWSLHVAQSNDDRSQHHRWPTLGGQPWRDGH